jgi:hypothetical protein
LEAKPVIFYYSFFTFFVFKSQNRLFVQNDDESDLLQQNFQRFSPTT